MDIKEFIHSCFGDSSTIIVEVGSHLGEDTIEFLQRFPFCSLYCFEPDPRNIKIFEWHINDPRVTLFKCAVSDKDSPSEHFYQGYSEVVPERILQKYSWVGKGRYLKDNLHCSGSSSLKKGHPFVENTNVIRTPTIRLDTWANRNAVPHIDFLWVDVQGAERNVLGGMGDFKRHIRYVWLEYGETKYEGGMSRSETCKVLKSLGFKVLERYSEKGVKGNLLAESGRV